MATDDRMAAMNAFFESKVPGMFGLRFTKTGPEGAEGELTVTEPLIAGTGFLFAPVVVGMADILCAGGIGYHLPAGASFTTVEMGKTMALFRNTQLVLQPRSP